MRRAPIILASFALVLSAASCLLAVVLFSTIADESRERRAQNCIVFERACEIEVKRLSNTYRYLLDIGMDERNSALNVAIAAQLPDLEQRVRTIAPPHYCDDPGVGLPEPSPSIPKRPKGL